MPTHGGEEYPLDDGARTSAGRTRAADRRSARLGHRPLQLPLPVLHARRGSALAGARGDPQLRGDRAAGRRVRLDGRRRRPPDRRRAARAARFPRRWPGCSTALEGVQRGLGDHQRLPARARRRAARRAPASIASTSRSTRCSATASTSSPAATRWIRCCAGLTGSPPSPRRTRSRSTPWPSAGSPSTRCSRSPSWPAAPRTRSASSSSCRWTPTAPGRRTRC